MESGGTRKVQAKGGRTAGEGMGRGGGDVEEGAEGNRTGAKEGKGEENTRWWDEECGRKKREVGRELRRWKRERK